MSSRIRHETPCLYSQLLYPISYEAAKHPQWRAGGLGTVRVGDLRVRVEVQMANGQGTYRLDFGFNNPSTQKFDLVTQTAALRFKGANKRAVYFIFTCPLCKRGCETLFMTEKMLFGCRFCANVRRQSIRRHDHTVAAFVKKPDEAKKTLASKVAPARLKMRAFSALERVKRNYERLTLKARRLQRQLKRQLKQEEQRARRSRSSETECRANPPVPLR